MTDTTSTSTREEIEREAFEALRAVVIAFDTIPSTRFRELLHDVLVSDLQESAGC